MLAQLGMITFEIAPINLQEIDHDAGASFAEHAVIGAMPSLEFVGEAPESWRVRGTMYPKDPDIGGGLADLEALQAMRRTGEPQPFMRGDGVYMGWVVIERISNQSSFLDRDGVGRVVRFDLNLKRSPSKPSASGIFNALVSLFL